jgi:hypothetical protein
VSATSTWGRPFAPIGHEVAAAAEWLFNLEDGWAEQAMTTTPVGLLVGEQPGPSSNPRLPLWPYPPGSAGDRLHRMSDIPVVLYLTRLARVNLSLKPVARWNDVWATRRLTGLMEALPHGARMVLVGSKARDAYYPARSPGLPSGFKWFERRLWNACPGDPCYVTVTAIPHPSARNPVYNDPATVAAARRAVRWAAGLDEE